MELFFDSEITRCCFTILKSFTYDVLSGAFRRAAWTLRAGDVTAHAL